MPENIGFVLNSIIVANPAFFRNIHHVTEDQSIMYFIEVVDNNTIRLREREARLLPEIIEQLREYFEIID